MTDPIHTKARDTLYGLFIGDALAMPVHWYYNRQALNRDYGRVTENIRRRAIPTRTALYGAPVIKHQPLPVRFFMTKPATGDRRAFTITSFSRRVRIP